MEIKILGGGCPKCERLEKLARQVVAEQGVEANFVKVKDFNEIMTYDVMTTPALVIDGQVKSSGRIPQKDEVTTWIQAEQKGA